MFQYHPCLIFRDSFPFIDFCLQSFSVAVLDDENLQIFIFIDIKTLEEIWALAFIHEFWFRFSQSQLDYPYNLVLLLLYFTHVDDFYCHFLLGLVVLPSVNIPIGADPK
jgi:hypothetical protein